MNDLAKERADHKSTQGTVKAMKESASREKARIAVKDSEIERLSEDVGNLDQNVVNLRTKLSESLERTASSNQKATNETRERSRIQTDNADLREKVASLTREISDLTEARSMKPRRLWLVSNECPTSSRRCRDGILELVNYRILSGKRSNFTSGLGNS